METAKQAYMEALNHDSRFIDIHLRLASLLAKTGQTKQAMGEAKKACEIDPADPRGHFMLGLLLEHLGQVTEAKQEKARARNLLGAYPVRGQAVAGANQAGVDNQNPIWRICRTCRRDCPKDIYKRLLPTPPRRRCPLYWR